MTLIEAHERGVLVGRCDGRRYNAHDDDCHCICQGANHGPNWKLKSNWSNESPSTSRTRLGSPDCMP